MKLRISREDAQKFIVQWYADRGMADVIDEVEIAFEEKPVIIYKEKLPSRYEAKLVKEVVKKKIGRPTKITPAIYAFVYRERRNGLSSRKIAQKCLATFGKEKGIRHGMVARLTKEIDKELMRK